MNKQNRSFRSIWYSTFSWLEYSIKQDLAYCYYYRHFSADFNLLNRVSKTLLRRKQLRLQMKLVFFYNLSFLLVIFKNHLFFIVNFSNRVTHL